MRAIINARKLYLKFKKSQEFQPVDLQEICKYFGIEICPWKFPRNCGISACLIMEDGFPYIGVSDLDFSRRNRFSIAHEVCHFLLHPKKNYFCKEGHDSRLEVDANYFAAELLVPAFELKKLSYLHTLKELCDIFLVSESAMSIRLAKLNLVCKDLMPEI